MLVAEDLAPDLQRAPGQLLGFGMAAEIAQDERPGALSLGRARMARPEILVEAGRLLYFKPRRPPGSAPAGT